MVIRKKIMFNWFKSEEKSLADRYFEARAKEEPTEEPERTYYSIGPSSKGRHRKSKADVDSSWSHDKFREVDNDIEHGSDSER